MNRLIIPVFFIFTSFSECCSQVTPGIKLISSLRTDGDYFGSGVAIDVQFAVVGASNVFANDPGSATIFERDGSGNWNEVQRLVPSDIQAGDHFGESVALSGNYLAISSPTADSVGIDSTITDAGAVYIFERDPGGVWQQAAKIWAFDGRSDDQFGRVALSGKYLVVGSFNDYDQNGTNYRNGAGAAYVFERTDGGEWFPVQKLVASDRNTGDSFAWVAVDAYTTTIAVGAPGVDTDAAGGNALSQAGAAYIFKRNAGGDWNETQKITAAVRDLGSSFGAPISVSGGNVLVGAQYEDTDENNVNYIHGAGAAYLFGDDGSGWFSQIKKIVAHDRHSNDNYGNAVSISGNYALIAAFQGNTDEAGGDFLGNPGAAYLYEKTGSVWSFKKKLVAPDRNAADEFGTSVCISGAQMIIGAPREDDDPNDANIMARGAAYIFTIQDPLALEESELFSISVYPNPTDGKLTLTNAGLSGDLTIRLRDLTGKLLCETYIPNQKVILYDINQPKGVYFLEISSGEGVVAKKVLVH